MSADGLERINWCHSVDIFCFVITRRDESVEQNLTSLNITEFY